MDDIGPFHNRRFEWDLYSPLVGSSMLELGNKINEGRTYKEFFEARGFRHVSVDMNELDGALGLDLSTPIDLGTFDMITNIGTTEHVSEGSWAGQSVCWENILRAMHVGSVLICTTPKSGHWSHHGVWYPTPEFYERLADENGLEIERIYVDDGLARHYAAKHFPDAPPTKMANRDMLHARLVRVKEAPIHVSRNGMFRNKRVRTPVAWVD